MIKFACGWAALHQIKWNKVDIKKTPEGQRLVHMTWNECVRDEYYVDRRKGPQNGQQGWIKEGEHGKSWGGQIHHIPPERRKMLHTWKERGRMRWRQWLTHLINYLSLLNYRASSVRAAFPEATIPQASISASTAISSITAMLPGGRMPQVLELIASSISSNTVSGQRCTLHLSKSQCSHKGGVLVVALVYVGACGLLRCCSIPLSAYQLYGFFFALSLPWLWLCTNPMGYDRPECLCVRNLARLGAHYLFISALSRRV